MHFDKFLFVDLFLDLNSVETVALLCRKAERAERHFEASYEPLGGLLKTV